MASSPLHREATRTAAFATAAVAELERLVARGVDVHEALVEARTAGQKALLKFDRPDA